MIPTFRLQGHDELIRKLRTLEKRTQNAIGRKVVRAGGAVVVKAMRNAASQWPGLRRSMSQRVVKSKRGGSYVSIAGPRRGMDNEDGIPYTAISVWLENGTEEREHKSGKKVGRMPESRYATIAWDASKGPARQAITTKLRSELMTAAK